MSRQQLSKNVITFGIRKESKNKWERRVPLSPFHVEKLVKDYQAKVIVQPSTHRIFPDQAYLKVTTFFL